MFKKAKKLNKLISTLFMVAVFGFFACTIHIFPSHHETDINDKVAHHHESDKQKTECVDHDTSLANPKNEHLTSLENISLDHTFTFFNTNKLIVSQENFSKYLDSGPPTKHKSPIFIINNSFLI